MKKIEVKELVGPEGKTFNIVDNSGTPHPAKLPELLMHFCRNLPLDRMTMVDAGHGTRVVQAASDAKETLDLEDADLAWLVEKVETVAPQLYGLYAFMLRDALVGNSS